MAWGYFFLLTENTVHRTLRRRVEAYNLRCSSSLKGCRVFWMSFLQPKPKKGKLLMKSITLTLVAITGLGLCAAPLVLAEDDSFVGKWKFNPDKSQLNGLTYKVRSSWKWPIHVFLR